jgi:beta-lactamase regulating signal transducer with metallopeptidase domain
MNALDMHFVAQLSVERLANCLAAGTLIALFAWLLLRMIGRRNSGTRFAVWFCALLAIAVAPFVEFNSTNVVSGPASRAAVMMPRAWSLYLFGAWGMIAAFGLVRVVVGLWHLRSIRKNCTPVDLASLDPAVAQTLLEFRAVRPVELCASDDLRVPTAVGFLKPAVVLPKWALTELSPAELHAVLLHELAHLQRWDDWTNLAQKFLRAVFFFHPAVWFVENRLSLEREMACDDLVLSQTANPRAYAECLVSLAEKNFLQRGIAFAQAAVGRMRQTSLRILQILDARRSKTVSIWKPAPWVVVGFSIACLLGAEHAPRLVAFSDPAAPRIDASIPSEVSFDRDYTPAVVPVSYSVDGLSKTTQSTTTRKDTNWSGHVHHKASVVHTTFRAKNVDDLTPPASATKQRVPATQATQPALQRTSVPRLRASAPNLGGFALVQQAVFVVVQDNAWGNGAPVVWQFSVWQVKVVPRTTPRAVFETSSQSI